MMCKNCGNHEEAGVKFCSMCGQQMPMEEPVKVQEKELLEKCSCGFEFENEKSAFCPKCGKKRQVKLTHCPNCNTELENEDATFCPFCGKKIYSESLVDKVKENSFIKSVGEDLSRSKSIKMIKETAKTSADKIKSGDKKKSSKIIFIIIAVVIAIAALILILNLNTCENCGEVFLGEGHDFFGDIYCDDCWF